MKLPNLILARVERFDSKLLQKRIESKKTKDRSGRESGSRKQFNKLVVMNFGSERIEQEPN